MDLSSIGSNIANAGNSLASMISGGGVSSAARGSGDVLKLGDFTFQGMEIPEMMTLGGDQQTVVHQLVGGARVIDQLGPSTQDIAMRGLLLGSNVMDRAVALSTMRKNGGQYVLTFNQLRYNVVIKSIRFEYYAFNRIGFEIVCIELPPGDPTQVVLDVDATLTGDLANASSLAGSIGNSGISSAVGAIQSATAGISSFAKAATSTIQGVLAPVQAAQTLVKQFSTTLNNTVRSVTTLGGIAPNNPVAQSASQVLTQLNTMNQLTDVNELGSLLGRMHANLHTLASGSSPRTVTVVGGDLMKLAQQYYGDPMQWTKIAAANGLKDPVITGQKTLTIPK